MLWLVLRVDVTELKYRLTSSKVDHQKRCCSTSPFIGFPGDRTHDATTACLGLTVRAGRRHALTTQ